jgi:multidrug efflux pump subunit AcrA (membrane-fusion protein)
MRISIILASAAIFLSSSAVLPAADSVTIPNCLLRLDAEATVPAQEEGVVTKIPVREGQQVAVGELLAQIDDAIPLMQYKVAEYKLKVAEKQASDNVDVRFATAAAAVALAVCEQDADSNQRVPGVIPQATVREHLLEHRKMILSIEKAEKDRKVAELQAEVARAELQAAEVNLKHRLVTAPLDGLVTELTRHEGEWVQRGEPIMRVLRMDRLRVEGFLNAKEYRQPEVQGRPVTVVVKLAGDRTETFAGKIVYVKPSIEAGGEFQVRAEVQNRRENGVWVLIPGMNADMTIQLK